MSNKKITDLPVLATFADDDVLPIVDVSSNVTKQSYIQDLATRFSQGLQSTLISGTNIKTINSTSLLGSGDISISANPSGGAGLIQFSDGSAFASDSNLFWDNTNKRLGVGTSTPTRQIDVVGSIAVSSSIIVSGLTLSSNFVWGQGSGIRLRVDTPSQGGVAVNTTPQSNVTTLIKGWGSTSATTALLVQNSGGTELFKVNDVGDLFFNGLETSSMRIHTFGNINKGISIDNEIDMGAFSGITFKTWDGSAYSNFMRINGNTASRGLIIGGTTNDASANLQIDSTTQGVLFPRMTTTQKNAISSPAAGLQVYDTTLNQMSYYNGSSWINF